jgi:AraC family transcriptional regulator, regulatory protein of adaptative response / DNA-3-methyladenine glycosylase II
MPGDGGVGFLLARVAERMDGGGVYEDFDRCVRAVRARDARFDGWFFVAVRSTRIYCRPSCPAPPSKVRNYTFYPTAAAAQRAGYRACKRCRPDVSPGSPEWNIRADVTARAMRLISDGVVDREGVGGLAARLGYSRRHVERQLLAELGAGPLALARAQRAQSARLLVETSQLPMSDVAWAAGFSSVRSFNDTVRSVFAMTPSELRRRAQGKRPASAVGSVSVRLPFRAPLCACCLLESLAATAVPGVEECCHGVYRRTLRLPHGHGTVSLEPRRDHIACRLSLTDLRDLGFAISRCRWLLDLDADPVASDDILRQDTCLAARVAAHPGVRVPRTVDGAEFAVRAVLGPPHRAAVRRQATRLVECHGTPIVDDHGGLTHLFPTAASLAALDPAAIDLPPHKATVLTRLAEAISDDLDTDLGADWIDAHRRLTAVPGLDPWMVEAIIMRALGNPDALPVERAVLRGAGRLGLPTTATTLVAHSAAWRPWRSYAVQHLIAAGRALIPPSDARRARVTETEERSGDRS